MLRFNRRIFIRQFSSSPPTSSFSSPPHPLKSSPTSTTVSPEEIKKFVDAAQEWWDPNGKSFGMLHRMNPVRVGYIRDFVDKIPLPGSNGLEKDLLENTTDSSNKSNSIRPFSNLKMLDIGCGGGLLSESLARLGGDVIGADAGLENIQIAKLHMLDDPGLSPSTTTTATTPAAARLQYMHTTAERLAESQPQSFDVVCALEIIEHVADRKLFLQACSQLVKPGGLLFFSTINRTLTSKLFTIILAEHLLNWVPKGTHDHEKYVTPDEMRAELGSVGCDMLDITGIGYDPLRNKWFLMNNSGNDAIPVPFIGSRCDLEMNYILAAKKRYT